MKANVRGEGKTLPLLFHGTSAHRARQIVEKGFRRAKVASYTGTAVNLTEAISIAWDHGPERCGKILAVTLAPQTRWQDAEKLPVGQVYDSLFASGELDALRTYGGNVWLLWTLECAQVRLLTLTEIMAHMVAQFRVDGSGCGYNGEVGPLSTMFWQGEAATYSELRICAPSGFDVEAWKLRKLAYYRMLLDLVGVKPEDGRKARP